MFGRRPAEWLLVALVGVALAQGGCTSNSAREGERPEIEATRFVLANLGGEHIRNTDYRRTPDGDYIVAWGHRILEWKVREADGAAALEGRVAPGGALIERVPPRGDIWYANGGCVLDVDGDGSEELVTGWTHTKAGSETTLVWYDQTDAGVWVEHRIATVAHGRWGAPHDIRPLRVRGRLRGVVVLIGRRDLLFFELPADVRGSWRRHEIARLPVGRQSGMLVGDVDADGIDDVVVGSYWVQTPREPAGGRWAVNRYGTFDENGWGGMAKHALADFDQDGRAELVVSEAEIPGARLALFDPQDAAPTERWHATLVDSSLYCPHSLAAADFDRDGRVDVIAAEMTAGGWDFPMNERPAIYAYLQTPRGGFRRVVLEEGLGVHEMALAPVRIEGRHLFYGADEIQPQKFDGMETHVSYWLVGPVR